MSNVRIERVRREIEDFSELKQTLKVIDSLPDNLKLRITDYRAPTLRGGRMHFLTGLLPGEVVQFSQIMRNRSISEDKRIELLRLWASDKLSVDASDYFEKFVKIHAERTARFQKKVDRLSEEAKLAFSRLQAINKEKQNIVTGLSPRAKNELATLWNLKCRNVRRPSTTFEADGPDLDADELSLSCTTSSGVLTRLRPTDRGSQTPSTAALEMPTKSDPRQVENAPDVEWHTFWQKLFSLHSATPTS